MKESIDNYNVPEWMKEIYERDESKEIKYVPTEIHCVWVVDRDKEVYFVGQVPRGELEEEHLALPDWVYDERDYGGGRAPERIWKVEIGTFEEYLARFLVSKIGNSSFKVAGLEVY